jgi:ribosomal protein S27E
MQNGSTGRFERLQCVKCGAHALVPPAAAATASCEVCGGSVLVPVDEPTPTTAKFSHGGRESA